ncbi:hypothetical protein [Streptomyces violascens]|nr:hypothetical protein [Streptomyces violascens]
MSTAPDPPKPNPRQSSGFLVTTSLPDRLPASRLQQGDTFALPEHPDEPLIIDLITPNPERNASLLISTRDRTAPITLHMEEPIQPLRMPRTFNVTCQLCEATTTTDLELVAHGQPKTWVCNRH